MNPSSQPSGQPSTQPSMQPTGQPVSRPSLQPTSQPSCQPSQKPQVFPSSEPSAQPSMRPSSQPMAAPSSQPSYKASKQPSSTPTANPSYQLSSPSLVPTMKFYSSEPTVSPTIGTSSSLTKIVSIVAIAESNNVSLTVTLSTLRDIPGAVFCVIMEKGNFPTSIGAIKGSGIFMQYTTPRTPQTIVISGLLALVSYHAYCFVEQSDGSRIAYPDGISKSEVFRTTCCRRVLISHAPSSVYGDISFYSSTNRINDISTYVFSYHLESPPSVGSVTITPIFTSATAGATNYTVISVPASRTFLSSYTGLKLSGEFYLSTATGVSGDFIMSLSISGQDRENFTTASARVSILSINEPLRAPELLSCAFDSSGGYAVITFSGPTDHAGITADVWPCGELFLFSEVNSTVCSWTSLSTVKVMFVEITALSLKPTDLLSVIGGLLRAACRPGTTCTNNYLLRSQQFESRILHKDYTRHASSTSGTVVVQGPITPIPPVIAVIVPSKIGPCSALMIDLSASTGNGGRPWTSVLWTVAALNGNSTGIKNFLTNYFDLSSSFIIIPSSVLLETTYSIGVTITNFLGDYASSSAIVSVLSDPNLPIVTILGSLTRTITASDFLSVQGSATVSTCGLSNSLNYTWAVTNSSGVQMNVKSTSIDPSFFLAPAYTFVVDASYLLTLTVVSISLKGQRLSSASMTANIYIKHGDIKVAVRGGYIREIAVDKVLTLDASISSDEDTSTGSKGLLFSWSCTVVSLASFGTPCIFSDISALLTSSSVFTLPANQMDPLEKYSFSVTAVSADGRSSGRSVSVRPLLAGSPAVFSTNTLTKFNVDSKILIVASITANDSMMVIWTAYYNGLPVPLDRAYTSLTRVFTAKEMSVTANYPLAILPNTFVAGRTYTFRLSAYPPSNTALLASTEIVLTVNSPPTGGRVTTFPLSGYALSTDFTMTAIGWSDDLSDYPLSYRFAYQFAKSDLVPALIIAAFSPLPYTVSLLPPGRRKGLFKIVYSFICYICIILMIPIEFIKEFCHLTLFTYSSQGR